MYFTAASMSVDCSAGDGGGNQCSWDLRYISGENWLDVDGPKLCSMTPDEFVNRDRHHGQLLYRLLHQLPLDDRESVDTH
jgi:Sterile alpha motif (SAM)/Pointed domain